MKHRAETCHRGTEICRAMGKACRGAGRPQTVAALPPCPGGCSIGRRTIRADAMAVAVVGTRFPERGGRRHVVQVRPGGCTLLDGAVLGTQSAMDKSPVTGESMLVARILGEMVPRLWSALPVCCGCAWPRRRATTLSAASPRRVRAMASRVPTPPFIEQLSRCRTCARVQMATRCCNGPLVPNTMHGA